jgi:hypothetical protein
MITSFTATPSSIRAEDRSVLSWTTSQANAVFLDNGIGTQPLNGSVLVSPQVTTKYTLNAGGAFPAQHEEVMVTVEGGPKPIINSFTANPPQITAGQSATLIWSSANGAAADIDNGIGRVEMSGTRVVTPSKTTMYQLWVNGAGGASTKTATVFVGQRRPPDIGTLAGVGGDAGSQDGSARAARFRSPWSITTDASGNTIVADSGNNTIRRISKEGRVETIAGTAGVAGKRDGRGTEAQFNFEFYGGGVAADAAGNIYVGDTSNNTVRKIAPDGQVTTIAGNANEPPGSVDGRGSEARFNGPSHLVIAHDGTISVADTSNHTIRKIATDGTVSTVAGGAGLRGYADGSASIARFNLPHGLTLDGAGNLYVGDVGNDAVRKITSDGQVTTLAGGPSTVGKIMTNAGSSAARFSFGCCGGGLAIDADGLLYVADRGSQTIRTVTPDGEVSTVAGSGGKGTADGPAPDATFNNPIAVATDNSGRLFIADTDNHSIRATQAPATRRRAVKP